MDERYKKYFRMSIIENLENIKKNGVQEFLEKENAKWKCEKCGGKICCHNGLCFNCDLDKLKSRKRLYRWSD